MREKPTEELESVVFNALENPKYLWRTIDGISKETSMETSAIRSIIRKRENRIVRSSRLSRAGKKLYTTRRHFRLKASPIKKIWGALKNRAD